MTRTAWGHGLVTITDAGTVLDTWYPSPALGDPGGAGELAAPAGLEALAGPDDARGVRTEVRLVTIDLDTPPSDAPDAYLRLHLLSHRLCAPNTIDLDGLFGVLPNVVWTTQGPCAVDGFELTRTRLRAPRSPSRCSASTSSPAWSTTSSPRACASVTPTASASAPTSPTAPR